MKTKMLFCFLALVVLIGFANPVAAQATETRADRLIRLDAVYRSQGWNAWLTAAGVTCQSVVVEARQPEEEIVVDTSGTSHIVVSGLQLRGQCTIPWPAILTTDRPGEVKTNADSRTYQPDLRNASVMYTNVMLNGQGTIWADGSNWDQLNPGGALQPTAVNTEIAPTQAATQEIVPTVTKTPTSTPTTMPTDIRRAATATNMPTNTPTVERPAYIVATNTPTPTVVYETPNLEPVGQNIGPWVWILAILVILIIGVVVLFVLKKIRNKNMNDTDDHGVEVEEERENPQ